MLSQRCLSGKASKGSARQVEQPEGVALKQVRHVASQATHSFIGSGSQKIVKGVIEQSFVNSQFS